MTALIAFLNARLDEDDAAANEIHRPRVCGSVDRGGEFDPDPIWCSCDYPARALREIAAKRVIVTLHASQVSEYGGSGFKAGSLTCSMCGEDDGWSGVAWPCRTVRALVAIYSDHPDYRQEWAP